MFVGETFTHSLVYLSAPCVIVGAWRSLGCAAVYRLRKHDICQDIDGTDLEL